MSAGVGPAPGQRIPPPGLDAASSYDRLRHGGAAVALERDVVIVHGPDARSFLQGQVTQDIDGLAPGQTKETLVLSPQGKIEAFGRLTMLADDVALLDVEAGFGGQLADRLRRFRLRVKAEIETGSAPMLALRGISWSELPPGVLPPPGEVSSPTRALGAGGDWLVTLPVAWPGWSGLDVLGAAAIDRWPMLGVPAADPVSYEAVRIEAGVPAMGRELTERTIPHEAGALVERAVSLTKGCYTGQELVARLDSRGANVARRLRGVLVDTRGTDVREGAEVMVGDRVAGTLTSVAWSPGLSRPVALAYVRRDVVPPASGFVSGAELTAEIVDLPFGGAA